MQIIRLQRNKLEVIKINDDRLVQLAPYKTG